MSSVMDSVAQCAEGGVNPSRQVVLANPVDSSAAAAPTLQLAPLSPKQEAFVRVYLGCRNAAQAYRETHDTSNCTRGSVLQLAYRVINLPQVRARIREYESAAAAATVIDVQAILAHDLEIIEAARHGATQLTSYVHECCRYCHGTQHKYQWIDFTEFLQALSTAEADNDERRAHHQREKPLPNDDGGYGYTPGAEPHAGCPQCMGHGVQRAVFADTTALSGPAAALYRGVKVTANGVEYLMQDVDKAKDRVLRAAGAFGDDAASVARGAAAGAAMGAAVAQATAERMKALDADAAERLYLDLVR